MQHTRILIVLAVLTGSALAHVHAQTVVHDSVSVAAPVVLIIDDTDHCQWSVDVPTMAGFEMGDRIILHQVKGARCAQEIPTDSGSITDMGMAGRFEFNWVSAIDTLLYAGTDRIYLQHDILAPFNTNDLVQIVKVIRGNEVRLQGTVSARPWDGASGGVVAIEATELLSFYNADVTAYACGFAGGEASVSNTTCDLVQDMHGPFPSTLLAQKGEGAAAHQPGSEAGRAALANGGGGGASYASGGGGGGGAGAGGRGGLHSSLCWPPTNTYGLGGSATTMQPDDPRLLFGGGGGGAHRGEGKQEADGKGGAGGGAVLIVAPRVTTSDGDNIVAAGRSISATAVRSGAAGGGGGGTILLFADEWSGTGRVTVSGGSGGNIARTDDFLYGPGGGGGGGHIGVAFDTSRRWYALTVWPGWHGMNQEFTEDERYHHSQVGTPGIVHAGIVLPPEAVAPVSGLESDGDLFLGFHPIGTTVTTTFTIWNAGTNDVVVSRIYSQRGLMNITGATPQPPTNLAPGDTMRVTATIMVTGDSSDALIVEMGHQCYAPLIVRRTWRELTDQSCNTSITLEPDVFSAGERSTIAVVLAHAAYLQPGATFTVGLTAQRNVLHLEGATLAHRVGVDAAITNYQYDADHGTLFVEGTYWGASAHSVDTLFSLNVLALFSADSVTDIAVHPEHPFVWSPDCNATVLPAHINVGTVCATRALRLVTFTDIATYSVRQNGDGILITRTSGDPSGETSVQHVGTHDHVSSYTIHDLRGVLVSQGDLTVPETHIQVAQGVYVVSITHAGNRQTILVASQ